jgi:hypothetical protein
VFVIHIEAYDWNCPQHITPRYTAEEVQEGMRSVQERIQTLEQQNEELKKEVARLRAN